MSEKIRGENARKIRKAKQAAKFIEFKNNPEHHEWPEIEVKAVYHVGGAVYKKWMKELGLLTPEQRRKAKQDKKRKALSLDPDYNHPSRKAVKSTKHFKKKYGVHQDTIARWMKEDGIEPLTPTNKRIHYESPISSLINAWRR